MASTSNETVATPYYRAFISYSHRDKKHAQWLHNALERYRLPRKLIGIETSVGVVPSRLTPIFRDQDELPASGSLGARLQEALARSMFLIVICSPASARSKWVNEEIRRFKQMHGPERVLALIVDGEPHAEDEEQECFTPALRYKVSSTGEITDDVCEPIAADLRKDADGRRLAKLKLISGLTGLRLDNVVQREATRRIRTLLQVSAVSVIAAVVAVGLAVYANDRRQDANAQRLIAEQESQTAHAVSDFLVDIFAKSSSIHENPNDITAKSILDLGAQRLSHELQAQPHIQTRLSSVIAMAYNNLGLFDKAIELVDNTAARSGMKIASAYLTKAEALRRKGELDAALDTVALARTLASQVPDETSRDAKLSADAARIEALIYYQQGRHDAALNAFSRSLALLQTLPDSSDVEVARLLQNRALLLSDTGDWVQAAEDLKQAKALAIAGAGENDILVGQIALAQAQVNFLSGNLSLATEQIAFAIEAMQRILEADNPALADAYSMQGQILHATGDLDQAQQALQTAINVYTNAYGGRHYLSGIAEVYLGLIAGDKNELESALYHFDEARLHYDASYNGTHPNHGDLLVNRATVLASAGEAARARRDCDAGMVILNDTLGKDAAFTQQLQAVCDALDRP